MAQPGSHLLKTIGNLAAATNEIQHRWDVAHHHRHISPHAQLAREHCLQGVQLPLEEFYIVFIGAIKREYRFHQIISIGGICIPALTMPEIQVVGYRLPQISSGLNDAQHITFPLIGNLCIACI